MRKLLGKLGRWLYLKYGEVDVVGMTRAQLNVLPKEFDLDSMEPQERLIFVEDARRYKQDEFLNKIFGIVIKDLKERIVYHSRNEMELFCDRFSINGVSLLQEKIEEIAAEKEDKDEVYDVFSVT